MCLVSCGLILDDISFIEGDCSKVNESRVNASLQSLSRRDVQYTAPCIIIAQYCKFFISLNIILLLQVTCS